MKKEIMLLNLIEKFSLDGEKYIWSIIDCDVMGDLGEKKTAAYLRFQSTNSPAGVLLGWEELLQICSNIEQVITFMLVAYKTEEDLLRNVKLDIELESIFRTCELGIEIEDSQCWRVVAKNSKLLKIVQELSKDIPFSVIGTKC